MFNFYCFQMFVILATILTYIFLRYFTIDVFPILILFTHSLIHICFSIYFIIIRFIAINPQFLFINLKIYSLNLLF